MNAQSLYFKYMRKNHDNPETIRKMINFGINYEMFRIKNMPHKYTPKAMKEVNCVCLKYLKDSLFNNNYIWLNLFAPSEIIHSFNINSIFIEAYSGFISGFELEDLCIDKAENIGMSNTLCSFHRTFIGAYEKGLLKKPLFAVTSSMICDANLNTFKYLSDKFDIPLYIIDVPHEYNDKSLKYLVNQLEEMVEFIENVTGKKFNFERLKEVIRNENESRNYLYDYLKALRDKNYPKTMTHQMFMMYLSHVYMGKKETLNCLKMLSEDIQKYSINKKKRILWVHTLPFLFKQYKELFDYNKEYEIICMDLNYDYFDMLDEDKPFESIAKKMINNPYNGNYMRKVKHIMEISDLLKPDGVVNFCHWGCKQASGGVSLLKDECKKKGLPFLSIDGDCLDNRNNQAGQLKTRMDAFLEII